MKHMIDSGRADSVHRALKFSETPTRAPLVIDKWQLCGSVVCVLLTVSILPGQDHSTSFNPRPAPQISGTLIGTDGVRKVILEYKNSSQKGTFIGNIQSACA